MRTRLLVAGVAALMALGGTVAVAQSTSQDVQCTITDNVLSCPLPAPPSPVTVTATAATTATVTPAPVTVTATQTVTAAPSTSASPTPPISSPSSTTVTSSASATTSATVAPPVTGTNCAANPSACGFPDATNTGAKGTLKKVPGQVTSGQGWTWVGTYIRASNGAVLDGLELTGADISVEGNNVTIRNVKINGYGEGWGIAIRHATNTLIEDVTIAPVAGKERLMVGIKDIYADSEGTMIRRVNIAGTSTGVQMESGTLRDSYIHDMGYKNGDHINGFTSNGGTTLLTIQHNTVLNQIAQTDAISLFQDFGAQRNRVIEDNLMAGGGYTLYAGANPGKEANATQIVVRNNRFSKKFFPNGGSYGPYTAWNPNGAGNVWTGNVWDENNAPLN